MTNPITAALTRYYASVTGTTPTDGADLDSLIARRRGSTRRSLEAAAALTACRPTHSPKLDIDPHGRSALLTSSGSLGVCSARRPDCPHCAHRVSEVAWDTAMTHLDSEADSWTGRLPGRLWLITATTRDDAPLREQLEAVAGYMDALGVDTRGRGMRLLLATREINAKVTWGTFHPHLHAVVWTHDHHAPELGKLNRMVRRHWQARRGDAVMNTALDVRGGAPTPENAESLIAYALKEFQPAGARSVESIATHGTGLTGLLRVAELEEGLGEAARGMLDDLMIAEFGRGGEGLLPGSSVMMTQRRPAKLPGQVYFRARKFKDWEEYDRDHVAQVKQGVVDAVGWRGYWALPEGIDPRAIPSDGEVTDRERWAEDLGDPAAEAYAASTRWDAAMREEREAWDRESPTPEMVADQAREEREWGDGADAERAAWESFWAAEGSDNSTPAQGEREGREERVGSAIDMHRGEDSPRRIHRRTRRRIARLRIDRDDLRDRSPPIRTQVATGLNCEKASNPILVRVDILRSRLGPRPPPVSPHRVSGCRNPVRLIAIHGGQRDDRQRTAYPSLPVDELPHHRNQLIHRAGIRDRAEKILPARGHFAHLPPAWYCQRARD
ncbi:hypothetical protein [Gordonia sp. NPDC003422]